MKLKYVTPTVQIMEFDPGCILAGSATVEAGKFRSNSYTSDDDNWTDPTVNP